MATNNKTFAQRAKYLIKKYKGASYDPIQKKELEAELAKLAEEQEAYKQANGIGVQQAGAQQGVNPDGSLQYSGLGDSFVAERIPAGDIASTIHSYVKPMIAVNPELEPLDVQSQQQQYYDYKPYSTSVTPALVSGATSLIGNLIMGQLAGKRKVNYATVKPTQIAAEQINLSNERNQLSRQASVASRTGMRNVGTSSRTRGEYMGNVGNMIVGLNQNVADAYSKSYQTEALTNAQARQQASQFNAQSASNAAQYNANVKNLAYQQEASNKAEQQEYLSAAMESIPSTMQNIEQLKMFDAGLAVSTPQNYQLVKSPTGRKAYELWKKKYNVGLQYKKPQHGQTD